MTNFVSAGVYSVERDLSQYVSDLSTTILGLVGSAEIGPTNTPVLITSPQEYKDIFGGIGVKHFMGYAADAYLKKGNLLWVNRVAPSDAVKALNTFVLPATATNYEGDWVLSAQSATSLTLTLTDSLNASGSAKTGAERVVKLDANTAITNFDFTDSGQAATHYVNNMIGSDLYSFIADDTNIVGNIATVTLGPGKGTSAYITSLIANAGNPAITVPSNSFSTNNSPSTAYAVGSIIETVSTTVTGPITLCKSTATGGDKTIKIAFTGMAGLVTDAANLLVISNLKSTTLATKLTELESRITTTVVGATAEDIIMTLPIVLTTPSSAQIAYNLELISAAISALIYAMSLTAGQLAGRTGLLSWHDATLGNVPYLGGIGNATSSILTVTNLRNTLNEVIEVRLSSAVAGFAGTSIYPLVTGVGLSATTQSISGKFTTSAYRPTWVMESAGSLFVPTYIKISSLGEADSSNTTVSLSFDPADVNTLQQQNYTLNVYERIVSVSIPTTSFRLADFQLVEQFKGTIESIQSNIKNNSRRIAMKLDYSSNDLPLVAITTGIVNGDSKVGLVDNLVHTPVLVTSETGNSITSCFNINLGTSGYDMTFTNNLYGGASGSVLTKYDIIGSPEARTGIYAFANPEMLDINVLSVPGWSADPAVAKAMVDMCESRGDAIALIDTPFGLTVQEAVDYRRNILNINNSYAALYYPWVKIADTINKRDIFVPPSGMVAAQYAYTDQVSDVFYAPAGRTRGSLLDALAVERNLSQGDRDILSLNQINPIHSEAGYGIYIKGQRTLQTTTTALDRVNVRRLLLKLRKVIASASKSFEFEPGDSVTAQKLKQVAETLLDDHQRRGAIQSYTVDVGPNVNTPLVRENNELRMNISLIPVKTAEILIESYLIQNQGGGISLL